jgi:hypothetical protein
MLIAFSALRQSRVVMPDEKSAASAECRFAASAPSPQELLLRRPLLEAAEALGVPRGMPIAEQHRQVPGVIRVSRRFSRYQAQDSEHQQF